MATNLTEKQRAFISKYLETGNATKAAIAAGYSERGARVAGSRLLTNAKVSADLTRKREKFCKEQELSTHHVLQELAKLAFLDPGNFFNHDGSLKKISELDRNTAACITRMQVRERYRWDRKAKKKVKVAGLMRIKFADKGKNLERLGRHLGLFKGKLKVMPNDEFAGRTTEELEFFAMNGRWPDGPSEKKSNKIKD